VYMPTHSRWYGLIVTLLVQEGCTMVVYSMS
jgi:hypothetical protein